MLRVYLVPHMLLENIELQKLKNGILSCRKSAFLFFSSYLSSHFCFTVFISRMTLRPQLDVSQFVNQT